MAVTEAQRQASKRWYEKNKDKKNEARRGTREAEHREYYLKNKEKINKRTIEYAKNNREAANLRLQAYRKNNPERKLLNNARARAKHKGFDFNLTLEDIIIPAICPLLGIELSVHGTSDNSPSLDRMDNTKGYTKDNIWIISFKANRMKNTATIEELKTFSTSILKIL